MAGDQPSNKATLVALVIWGCVCFTAVKILTPLVGETIVGMLSIGAFAMLWVLIPMCQQYFDPDDNPIELSQQKANLPPTQTDVQKPLLERGFKDTDQGLKFYFNDGNHTKGTVCRNFEDEPIFYHGLDAFNFSGAGVLYARSYNSIW
jgi:hypothetical protein